MLLEKLDPEHMYYIIGLFQGDAHHSESSRNRGKIQLEIAYRDIELVYKLEKILSPLINVSISERTRFVRFKTGQSYTHTSVTLCLFALLFRQEMKPFLPVGSKCRTITPPCSVEESNARHYLRGLVDADGSVGITAKNIPYMSICVTSDEIKEFITESMSNVLGINKHINRNTRDNIYNIMLTNEKAQKYCEWLYSNSSLYLERKYQKHLEVLSWVRPNSTPIRKR